MTRSLVIPLATAAMLPITAITLAANPVKGARYSGHVRGAGVPITVTFKVSRSGSRLTSFTFNVPNLPNRCGYGGPDQLHPAKARIKNGRFTAKLSETTTGGLVVATATVTGRFRAGRREAGTIKTTAGTASCSGSFGYSTKAPAGR
jgi:hypothetical protein